MKKKKAFYQIRKDPERKLFTIEHSLQVLTLGPVQSFKTYIPVYILKVFIASPE